MKILSDLWHDLKVWSGILKDSLHEVGDNMNLAKKYPGYFKVSIFRTALIILGILFGIAVYQGFNAGLGIDKHYYVKCPNAVSEKCLNPFYVCNQKLATSPEDYAAMYAQYGALCDEIGPLPDPCPVCNQEYILPGESLGEKPPTLVENFWFLAFLLVALAFAFNHLYYLYRVKKQQQQPRVGPKLCSLCEKPLTESKFAKGIYTHPNGKIFCGDNK